MEYLPLLIKVGKSGAYSKTMEYDEPFDTQETYNLWVKHVPFTILPKTKDVISQTWKDEDGDDVFLSEEGAKHESYDWKVDFVYLENDDMAHENIDKFIKRISGKWLRIYDSYTRTTRDGAYVSELDQDSRFKRRGERNLVIFSITFKVNNPNYMEDF